MYAQMTPTTRHTSDNNCFTFIYIAFCLGLIIYPDTGYHYSSQLRKRNIPLENCKSTFLIPLLPDQQQVYAYVVYVTVYVLITCDF